MQNDNRSGAQPENDGTRREDEPIPSASDEKVLEETARLAREGRRELESDPKEPKASK
jgi:hypothetical protein